MFCWSAINSNLMRTLFNFPSYILIYTTQHAGNDIHNFGRVGSLNIHRLMASLFNLHLNLTLQSMAPWSIQYLQGDNALSNF